MPRAFLPREKLWEQVWTQIGIPLDYLIPSICFTYSKFLFQRLVQKVCRRIRSCFDITAWLKPGPLRFLTDRNGSEISRFQMAKTRWIKSDIHFSFSKKWLIGHFRVAFFPLRDNKSSYLKMRSSPGSFSWKTKFIFIWKFSTRTHFETEAKRNTEMAKSWIQLR